MKQAQQKLTAQTAAKYGVEPVPIVRTEIMWMTKFYTQDGEVSITCSKPDQKVVIHMTEY